MFKYKPNIYTGSLDKRCVNAAINHAKEEFPNESCGAIINNHYVRFKNEAEDISKAFEIKDEEFMIEYMKDNVECLVHSHNDFNRASFLDQEQQKELAIPSLIINLRNKSLMDCIVFGEKEPAPLEGRPFFWGAFDCVAIMRDYVLNEFGREIKYVSHDIDFWLKQENLFEAYVESHDDFKYVRIRDIRKGDILLYNINGSRYINHIAVYTNNNGQVLHHMYNDISRLYPINFNKKFLRKVWRVKND